MEKESIVKFTEAEEAANKDFDLRYSIRSACSFDNLLEGVYESPDSELFDLVPNHAMFIVDDYVKRVAGEEKGSEKRIKILSRIAEVINPLGKMPWNTRLNCKEYVLDNLLKEKDLEKQKTSINDIIWHFNDKVLERALQIDPSIKERALHIYSTIGTLNPFTIGIDKFIEFTSIGQKKVKNETKLVNLFKECKGDIPTNILKGLKDKGLIEDVNYDKYSFDKGINYLFLRNIYTKKWKESKDIAKLASNIYLDLLQKLGRNDYESEDSILKLTFGTFSTEHALWNWKAKNFKTLKEDILFIQTGSRKELPCGYTPIDKQV